MSFLSAILLALLTPYGLSPDEIPDRSALFRWLNPGFEDSRLPHPESLPRIELKCEAKKLYPTHPQQTAKIYHLYRRAEFHAHKLPGHSPACKITTRNEKKSCLLADTFEHAVISDLYQDACGNLYRGLWKESFLRREETMGTLFSRGRTMYPSGREPFPEQMEDGGTYALNAGDFLFLTSLFPGDLELVRKFQKEANATHVYDAGTRLFEKR